MQFQCQKQFYLKQFSLAKVQFSSIWPIDRRFHSRPEWTCEQWQWRGNLHSPKLQHYWNLTIRLFSVIPRTLMEGILLFSREAIGIFYSPSQQSNFFSKTGCLTKDKEPNLLYYLPIAGGENRWIHAFPKEISAKWNANSSTQELNSSCKFHLLQR